MVEATNERPARVRTVDLGRLTSRAPQRVTGALTAVRALAAVRALRGLLVVGLAFGILIAGTAPAGAATTPVSIFSKLGIDQTTGSTATGGGASGTTAAGHTIDWVLSYRNETGADAQVNITDPITGNHTYVPGSLQVPQGFTPQWSTDGGASYTATEPASGVNAVGATGVNGPGSTGTSAPIPPPARGFNAGSSQGDGWEPLFIGDNVYNVHHHDGPGNAFTMIDCHDKSSGLLCPGYPAVGLYVGAVAGTPFSTGPDTLGTAYAPNADVDTATGHIYFPVGVDGQGSIGVLCADVTTQTSCGYTQLAVSPIPNRSENGEWHAAIDGGAVIGSRYYLVDAQANVYCYDTSTNAACGAPYPIKAVPGYPASNTLRTSIDSRLQAFDGRYVFGDISEPSGSRDLICIDTTTNALCPGFPVRGYATDYIITGGPTQFNAVLAPTLSAGGAVTGICGLAATNNTSAPFKCYSVPGATPAATPWPQQVPGDTVTRAGLGSITRIGTKLYFPYSNETGGGPGPGGGQFATTYACWDFSIAAPCSAFVQASSGQNIRAYTVRQDPDNPGCLWELGDAGIFEVFSATFGGTSCNEGSAVIDLTPAADYCDGKGGHVSGWSNLTLGGVAPGDYDELAVSIFDANGNPVPGWSDRVFPSSQQTIDISSIPYAGTTTSLQIAVSIAWGAHVTEPATITASYTGDPVEVCFQTVVGPATCGAQSLSNAASAVTTVAGGPGDAPDGNPSGPAIFAQIGDPGACRADLELLKTAGSDVVVPGRDTTYQLEAHNNGPDPATDVVVSDRLPAGLSFVSASPGCASAGGVVSCRLSTLAAGASQTFSVVAHVAGSVDHRVTNTADVSSATTDPDPDNNSATLTLPLDRRADVSITKVASVSAVRPGAQVTYTLVAANHGPSDATGLTVTDDLPAGLELVRAEPAQGSCRHTGTIVCEIGSLAAGDQTQILVIATVAGDAHGRVANVASVIADQFDPDQANNTAHAAVDVSPSAPPETVSDLSVSKHVDHAAAYPGEKLTYTLTVANHGPDSAADVRVIDTSSLPMRVLSVHPSQGDCQVGPPLVCRLGTVGAGKQVRITVVAEVTAAGDQINAASITSASRDPNSANDLARTHTRVTPVIDVHTHASGSVIRAGGKVVFITTVRNPNNVALHNVRVCQALPVGLVPVSSRPATSRRSRVSCWTIRTLAPGHTVTFQLTARALQGITGNRATRTTATATGARSGSATSTVRLLAAPTAARYTG